MITKGSLVLLYLRIWTADSVSQSFRRTCWAMFGILISTATAGAFAIIFQCTPIPYAWRSVTGNLTGKCIQLEPFTYTYAALNITYDFIVLLLPCYSILKLRLSWQKKLGICAVFLVGFLVTICSIIRLQYLLRLTHTTNLSWDFQYIGMWSLVECNFSVVCACMPAMAGLAQRIWLKTFNPVKADAAATATQQMQLVRDADDRISPDRKNGPDNGASLELGGFDEHGRRLHSQQSADRLSKTASTRGSSTGMPETDQSLSFNNRESASSQRPAPAGTTRLSYRDHNEVLHEVEILDRPQSRASRPPTRNG